MTLIGNKYSNTLKNFNHRPFALEQSDWVLNQSWSNLLFAHWPVSTEALRALVPAALELDLYDGQAYIAVVPFEMREVSPRYLPSVPALSFFLELNVRTYVCYKGKPGVYFFSLDASNPIAVWLACNLYHLPYFNAKMLSQKSESVAAPDHKQFTYSSMRSASSVGKAGSKNSTDLAELDVSYEPSGPVYRSHAGSLEHFLTERYCLFTVYGSTVYRGDIHHGPWPLQQAKAEFRKNTMTAPLGLELKGEPILHFVENIDTVEWPIKSV
ncbi:DUF2071 domain-containing protein [soil metagenome]